MPKTTLVDSSLIRQSDPRVNCHLEVDRTGDLALAQKSPGHESITTSQRYLLPELKGRAEIVNKQNADQSR
jgi:hypothetical protein